MKMEQIRVEDFAGDSTEVSVSVYYDCIVTIDSDPDNKEERQSMMHYTPGQARKLALAILKAAEAAEAEEDEQPSQ